MENSIIYWCILYACYVLMPVIPAVIIYKNFPNTTVGANGLLGGLKINATGAFAAYIITCLLGIFIVKKAFTFIEDATNKNWTVIAQVRFVDENNKPLPLNPDELETETLLTNVIFNPPSDTGMKSSERFESKVACKSNLPCITYTNKGFIPQIIDLKTIKKEDIDYNKREINLHTIYLRKARGKYQPGESKNPETEGPLAKQ